MRRYDTQHKGTQQIELICDTQHDSMEQRALKIVINCYSTNIYSYLETSGGQSYKCCSFFQHQS
jgi:hypothetical protein